MAEELVKVTETMSGELLLEMPTELKEAEDSLNTTEGVTEELGKFTDDKDVGVAPTPERIPLSLLPALTLAILLVAVEARNDCGMLVMEMRLDVVG